MGSPFLSTTFPVTLNWLDFALGGGGVFSIISVTCKSAISNWLERLVTASSINIFKWNKDYTTSGNGAVFFSEPYGWNTGKNAGCFAVIDNATPGTCKNNIKLGQVSVNAASNFVFDYTNK